MKTTSDAIRTLIESTFTHVSRTILNKSNKEAYIKAMRRGYYICSEEANSDNARRMHEQLNKFHKELPTMLSKRYTLFSEPNRYYRMGIEHCLDIVKSMLIRFEDGYSHPDETFADTILRRSGYEDKF